jgi:spore cortex biosynthesis protein YabQ
MSEQFSYIFGLLATGLLMGMVFDIYNTVTGASKWLKWIRSTLDVAFWVASALAVFYVVFTTDDGKLRIYTYVLLATGYYMYRLTLHRTVVASAFLIVRFLHSVFRGLYSIVYTVTVRPVVALLRVVFALLKGVYSVLCVLETWIFRIVQFWLRVTLVRWILRLPFIQRIFVRFQAAWEEMWSSVSKWLRGKWERV